MINTDKFRNRIRGSLIGGAAGDALGYAVEFTKLSSIRAQYGFPGITEYEIDPLAGAAIISDDTQMTLFTAEGIMMAMKAGVTAPATGKLYKYVHCAYLDWYRTQNGRSNSKPIKNAPESRLMDVPALYKRRAPGITCLNALADYRKRDLYTPINNSKGCGGIMRVAPAGLLYPDADLRDVVAMGAEMSAITHSHPLGCFPSGIFAAIVQQAAFNSEGLTLRGMTGKAVDAARELYGKSDLWDDLEALIDKTISFAGNERDDDANIKELGEGWVGEEALAVALYCALRYENDFSAGIIAAVNHNGDSDSTGAIAGNILGAIHGYDAIDSKWKNSLEFRDLILNMSDEIAEIAGQRLSAE